MRRRVTLVALLAGSSLAAQQPVNCDSVLAAARVDGIETGLFISVRRIDGGPMSEPWQLKLALNIGAAFVPPKPFRVSVFSGPPVLRSLRSITAADTGSGLRAPSITGIYRAMYAGRDTMATVEIARESLIAGFDSAVVEAIRVTSTIRELFHAPGALDTLRLMIRFSSDSIAGAARLVSVPLPRMRVVDAIAKPGNPPPVYPAEAKADSISGEVVLRFVVSREGKPDFGTIEVIRAPSVSLVKASIQALLRHTFTPASVRGCPVAQVIDYPFSFVLPDSVLRTVRAP